jgi:hypothetical protein
METCNPLSIGALFSKNQILETISDNGSQSSFSAIQ